MDGSGKKERTDVSSLMPVQKLPRERYQLLPSIRRLQTNY
jgi:hypothetical protein